MSNLTNPIWQFNDSLGPIAGAKLYFYAAGSTNPKAVFNDHLLTSQTAQPLVADSLGIFPEFFTESGLYKIALYDADDQLLATRDWVDGAGASSGGSYTPDYKLKVINEDTVPHFLEYKIVPQSASITQTVVNNPTFGKQVSMSVRQDWLDAQIEAKIPSIQKSFDESVGSFGGEIAHSRLQNYNVGTSQSITFFRLYSNPDNKSLKELGLILSGSIGSYGIAIYDTDSDTPLNSTAIYRGHLHIDGHVDNRPYYRKVEEFDIALDKYVWIGLTFYLPASDISTFTNPGPFMFNQQLSSLLSKQGSSIVQTLGSAYRYNLATVSMPGVVINYQPAFTPQYWVPFQYYTDVTFG